MIEELGWEEGEYRRGKNEILTNRERERETLDRQTQEHERGRRREELEV
jgi:hypothetical protein